MTSLKDSTLPRKNLALEEETVKILHERLDALKILANVQNLEEVEEDVEARTMTVQVVKSVFNLIENCSLNMENAKKISTVLHAVASKIKTLASPETSVQNLPLASSFTCSHLKGELYLQLPQDFPMKASQTILTVLLRSEDSKQNQPDPLMLTTPRHQLELSYIVSVDSVILDIVVTLLESLAVIPGCSEELISLSAMDIFHKVHTQVKQFITLSKSTVEKHKTDIAANSQSFKPSSEKDVTTTCTNKVILQIYQAYRSNHLKVEPLKTTPEGESKLSVVDSVMFQLNELANTRRSSSQVFQYSPEVTKSPDFDGPHEVTKKVLSPEFQSMAHRKVIKVLSELDNFKEEACLGLVDSFAADVVEIVVESLQDLSRILETVNSVFVHRIYQNVQNKIRDLIIKQGKGICTSPKLSAQNTRGHDLQPKEHWNAPQGVACLQLLVSHSPLPPVESHSERNQVDVVSYTKEVIREVVKLFVLEEIKRQRSALVDGIPTPLEIKKAIARILSQIEDPQDELSKQGYVSSSTSLSMISLSTENMKTLLSKEFELKATLAVSDVLLEERDRTVSPVFVVAAISDRRQTSKTCHLCPTLEHHVSCITQSVIHLLQKMKAHQGGSTMNALHPSHLYQTVQDKIKAFFTMVQGQVPKGEGNGKPGNQTEAPSSSVKPSPKQNLDQLDVTTELESTPAFQHIGQKNPSPEEVHGNKVNEEDDTGSCMKDVFRKVLTLYIHEAKKKEKIDVNPMDNDLIYESVDSFQSQLESTSSSYLSTSYYVPERTLCECIFCGRNCHRSQQSSESSLSSSEVLSLSSESVKSLASEKFQVKVNELVDETLYERMEHSSFASSSSLTASSSLTSSMDQTSTVTITVIDTLRTLLCCTPPFLRVETMSADFVEKGQTSDVPSMLREVHGKIKEFFSLHKSLSVYSTSEVDGGSSIIGTAKLGTGYDAVVSKQGSCGKYVTPDDTVCKPTSEDCTDLEQNKDVDKAVARLDQFISSEEVETFSRDLACKLVCLLRRKTNQQLSLPKDLDSEGVNVSLRETYLFVEESVKGFLHKLLYPSCPSKVMEPDDFAQETPSSNTCMAKAAHESCSGNIMRPTHVLGEALDLLKDLVVNQVMVKLLPVVDAENEVDPTSRSKTPEPSTSQRVMDAENKADLASDLKSVVNPAVKDATCSTSSLRLISGLHTDSVNRFRRPKCKTEVKVCIKPKIRTLRINKKVQ